MELAVMQDVRRAQCEFPALNLRIGPGDGPEDIRLANVVVIEPIVGAGFKVVGIEGPAVIRDGHAELPLDVAFTVQRSEGKALTGGQSLQLSSWG